MLKIHVYAKIIFDIRYGTVHKQKHSFFLIYIFFVCVFSKSLDCESEEKSSHKFPISILLLQADILLYQNTDSVTTDQKQEPGMTKCTRNLWKIDSTIDETEQRSKLKAIFYSNAQNTKSRRNILPQNIRLIRTLIQRRKQVQKNQAKPQKKYILQKNNRKVLQAALDLELNKNSKYMCQRVGTFFFKFFLLRY